MKAVAIRFRWIWVGRAVFVSVKKKAWNRRNPLSLDMGWKCLKSCPLQTSLHCRNPLSLDMGWKHRYCVRPGRIHYRVAIRFRWIWVGSKNEKIAAKDAAIGRNPLSLDMGWK